MGCVCPESAFLRTLLTHLALQRDQHIVIDMEAGLEHLGRGTVRGMDALVVVVTPDAKSVGTARRIVPLWRDLGDKKIFFVGNEARNENDADFIKSSVDEKLLLGVLPDSDSVRNAAREGRPPFEDDALMDSIKEIRTRLESGIGNA
jgi:CO dehydrogenase maturation factor